MRRPFLRWNRAVRNCVDSSWIRRKFETAQRVDASVLQKDGAGVSWWRERRDARRRRSGMYKGEMQLRRGSELLQGAMKRMRKDRSIQVLEKVWQANCTLAGSTHILYSAGGEMTVAQRRCDPLANGWPEFAESARRGPPVESWRWGVLQRRPPRAWGRQRMKARATMPHPTETRLAESIRGLCCIDLVLGHTARWEKARHIRGILMEYRVEKSINYLHVVSFLFLLPCLSSC